MSKYARPKRAVARYWVLKKGSLYARLQYSDEFGKKREKYRKINAKGDARSVVEDMRQEVQLHGSETLHSDRVTFVELADKYESVRITPAVFCNGVKVSGKKSLSPVKSILKTLRAHFGRKPIRLIKASDIEFFKNTRIATPIIKWVNEERLVFNPKTKRKKKTKFKVALTSQRNISTINRELQTLKAIFN
ncbi:MAG: hypothetical protein H7070_04025, partial [Saprospiraceae bacterium]|nr:hypothetical protein [Pyrinomonadaceae bacterium]